MSPRTLSVLCVLCAAGGFQVVGALSARRPAPTAEKAQPRSGSTAATSGFSATPIELIATGGQPPSDPRAAENSLLGLANACEKAGSPAQARLALMEAIHKLKPEELESMLAREAGNSDFFRSSRFDFQFAARRLAEIAPERAAAVWLSAQGTHFGVDSLLAPWAKKNPEAFASWSLGLPADKQKAVASTMSQIASENPEQFLGIASQLAASPNGPAGARGAVAGLISKASQGEDPAAALAYARNLPAGPMRTAALAELARWPGIDVNSHPEVLQALASLNASDARRYTQQITKSAEQLPQGAVRERAFAAQVAVVSAKDPQSGAKRVEALAGSPDYPAAVRGFVDATAAKDPAAALEWALTINLQGTQRSAALEKAATEYFRQKPTEARKWVEKAPLTAQEYLMLTGRSR